MGYNSNFFHPYLTDQMFVIFGLLPVVRLQSDRFGQIDLWLLAYDAALVCIYLVGVANYSLTFESHIFGATSYGQNPLLALSRALYFMLAFITIMVRNNVNTVKGVFYDFIKKLRKFDELSPLLPAEGPPKSMKLFVKVIMFTSFAEVYNHPNPSFAFLAIVSKVYSILALEMHMAKLVEISARYKILNRAAENVGNVRKSLRVNFLRHFCGDLSGKDIVNILTNIPVVVKSWIRLK